MSYYFRFSHDQTNDPMYYHKTPGNLLHLVKDIPYPVNLEERKTTLSEKNIDLRQLAAHVRLINRMGAEERGNSLRVLIDENLPQYITIDDTRLSQILNKLVANSIKFTRNGSISIEVSLHEDRGDEVTIYFAVTDTGIGIEKDTQLLILNHMELTIVQQLLATYNSNIHFTSEQGEGSTFSFYITCKKGAGGGRTDRLFLKGRSDLSTVKILLVEDVEYNMLVAEKMIA